jgi:mannose-1-phosphate guanylyltransferase
VPLLGRETLLEATLRRLRRLAPPQRIRVVTAQRLARVARSALREHPGVELWLEPLARNTAAAIAWSAARVARAGGPVMAVFPADHHIPEPSAFVRSVRVAARAAATDDVLVLIGIEPTRPDPAYGYLRVEGSAEDRALPVRRFVEKPAPARARRLLRAGDTLWNAGMFIATPARILAETRAHAPEIWRPLGALLERIAAGRRVLRRDLEAAFGRAPAVSFDRAVVERSRRVRAVRGRFAWSDLGSWDALAGHVSASSPRRSGADATVSIDAATNVIWNTTQKTVALVGVQGIVVVETPDALLVCSQDRAQDVRRVVEELERRGRRDLL